MVATMANSARYATLEHPLIAAVVHGLYRLDSAQDAAFKLVELSGRFTLAKKQIDNPENPSLILWIKGFGLEPGDEKQGIIGHYAVIAAKRLGQRYTLSATKMYAPAKEHPQRAQVRRENPNWGHPVLRAVRRGKRYPSMAAAQAELTLLHEHFPSVSIPNPGRLYIMIYCAERPARERLVKYQLIITHDEAQNAYFIRLDEGQQKPRGPLLRASAPNTSPQGKFTAKVALQRKRKRK